MFKPLIVVAAIITSTAFGGSRPNVLFILVDDLGYADLSCYGNTLNETPNVDKLAGEGIRFTEAYAASAVCSPTRASIQTGQHPVRFGITDWIPGARMPNTPVKEKYTERMLPVEAITVADAFKQHGYQTAFIGKWHLNDKGHDSGYPEDQGYDINIGGFHKGSPPGGYFAPFKNPKMADKPTDVYLTDRLGDECIDLLEYYSKDRAKPFFMMLSFYTVHMPMQPKKELVAHYQKKQQAHTPTHWNDPKYAAMVHSMDQNVGRVLQALDTQGLADDTIVVFFSDNGGVEDVTSAYPLSRGKGLYQEGGIRVPLILRKPGMIEPGSVSTAMVSSNDLFPTLLDLAGLPLQPDAHKDGLSFKPVFEDGHYQGHPALYWHFPHYHGSGETPCSAIRIGDYKFIRHYADGSKELYHLKEDLGETSNLMVSMPEQAMRLEAALDAWLVEMNAYIPSPDPSYDPSKPYRPKRKKK